MDMRERKREREKIQIPLLPHVRNPPKHKHTLTNAHTHTHTQRHWLDVLVDCRSVMAAVWKFRELVTRDSRVHRLVTVLNRRGKQVLRV